MVFVFSSRLCYNVFTLTENTMHIVAATSHVTDEGHRISFILSDKCRYQSQSCMQTAKILNDRGVNVTLHDLQFVGLPTDLANAILAFM